MTEEAPCTSVAFDQSLTSSFWIPSVQAMTFSEYEREWLQEHHSRGLNQKSPVKIKPRFEESEDIFLRDVFRIIHVFQESFAGLLYYRMNWGHNIDYAEEINGLQFVELLLALFTIIPLAFLAKFLFTILQGNWISYHFCRNKSIDSPSSYRNSLKLFLSMFFKI